MPVTEGQRSSSFTRKQQKKRSQISLASFLPLGKCTTGMVRGKLNKILRQLETEKKLALTCTVTCCNCTLTQQTPVALPVLPVTCYLVCRKCIVDQIHLVTPSPLQVPFVMQSPLGLLILSFDMVNPPPPPPPNQKKKERKKSLGPIPAFLSCI